MGSLQNEERVSFNIVECSRDSTDNRLTAVIRLHYLHNEILFKNTNKCKKSI